MGRSRDETQDSGFAARLRALREEAGLSQKELAAQSGCSISIVQKLEQGLNEPTWPTVLALAKALGVDCTAFTEEPSFESLEPKKPGRPRKPAPADDEAGPSEESAADDPKDGPPPAKKGRGKKGK